MTEQTTSRQTYLGVPLVSHVDTSGQRRRAPQKPLEDLEPLLRAVLEDESIDAFGWTQYTPYFNDGEPCVFSVGPPWFVTSKDRQPKMDDDAEEGEDEDWEEDSYTLSYHPTLGRQPSRYGYDENGYWTEISVGEYEGDMPDSWMRCKALSQAIESEAYDDALLGKFGDHAKVTIRRSGITIDEYFHD